MQHQLTDCCEATGGAAFCAKGLSSNGTRLYFTDQDLLKDEPFQGLHRC